MAPKDYYEDLCKYYEFMMGKIPNKENFIKALQETLTPAEIRIFFLLPFRGNITRDKLDKKALKSGISLDELDKALKRLAPEGFIMAYDTPAGRAYERGNPAFMTEQQVRKQEDTPRRRAYAEFMDAIIEGAAAEIPNKTPYYRVMPVQATVTGKSPVSDVPVNIPVADPRQVLPLDIVSEMIKQETLIGVAECYCRKTKKVVGKECSHPLETCLVFSDIAQSLIESGIARQIDYDETMRILQMAEEQGLVHNVDNARGEIRSICNCCSCSCILLKTLERGQTNAVTASRFMAVVDPSLCKAASQCAAICPTHAIEIVNGKAVSNPERCIGCGHCVSRCPEGAIRLIPRSKYAKIYPSNKALWSRIQLEAVVGLTVNKILGK